MGILNLTCRFLSAFFQRYIGVSIGLGNISSGRLIRLLRHSGGIRTQIGDQSDGAVSLYLHALVELLGQAHSLLSGKVQCLGSLLLQSTGSKRQRRFLAPLAVLYLADSVDPMFQVL